MKKNINEKKDFTIVKIDGKKVFYGNFGCFARYYKGRIIAEDGYGFPHFLKKVGNKIVECRGFNEAELKAYYKVADEFTFCCGTYKKGIDLYVNCEDGEIIF